MTLMPSRRSFIKKAAISAFAFHYIPDLIGKPAPSDKVRVAHIGVNGMGTNHLNWFAKLPDVQTVALCDVDSNHLAKAKNVLLGHKPNQKVDTYDDFRRILDRKDIDAITCATPDHWHAQIAIMAFQAGKDVYGEKPLSYTAKEGQMMLASMNANKKIFQLGNQIHTGDNYHRVVELIQGGAIGKVKKVRLWKTGKPPVIEKASYQKVPQELNWDMWQGPAPERDYFPERCHFTYRYFMDYSGGVFQDFWCHIADIVWWSISPEKLKSIDAKGIVSPGIGDTPSEISIDYKFKGLDIQWTSEVPDVPGAAGKHIGAYFEGTKGTLLCDYGSKELRLDGEVLTDLESIPKTVKRSPGHQQNFIDSVKSRAQPESNLAYAREMTLPMHLGLISWQLGRPLKWDYKRELFKGDAEANQLLFREYRSAYNWI
ncbi:Gfo/Idh/MocA family oxidoreductase [uncultured Arcticibacterium sp.]|uniref:Gfo/Idh/MocA family protein n=1 Tax=uncultured Arcticibacterium sp. TaxID=2173042 RepID=UPI0030FB6F21